MKLLREVWEDWGWYSFIVVPMLPFLFLFVWALEWFFQWIGYEPKRRRK